MEFGLARQVLGSSAFLTISEAKYREIESAEAVLLEALFIEETFDVVVDNYLELEIEILKATARDMVLGDQEYAGFRFTRNLFNRRFINILSACRSYVDQAKHHLRNVFSKESDIVETVEEEFATQYDACLGYRVLEALRNYVQHRGFPVHAVTYNSKWIEDKRQSRLRFSIMPYIRPALFREDKKFKTSVLRELISLGDKVDLKPLVRQYIAAIGKVHEAIRNTLSARVFMSEATISDAIKQFQEAFPGESSIVGLAAVIKDSDSRHTKSVQIVKEIIEYRRQLERKNSNLGSLEKRYVTSEIIENNT